MNFTNQAKPIWTIRIGLAMLAGLIGISTPSWASPKAGYVEMISSDKHVFCFIHQQDGVNGWISHTAFPYRKIALPEGQYVVALAEEFNDGIPAPSADYFRVNITAGKTASVVAK